MTMKRCLLILASVSVIAACATAAWSSPTTGPSDSITSSRTLRLQVSATHDRLNARDLQDANLSGKVAIFTNRLSKVRLVAFYLDDPKCRRVRARLTITGHSTLPVLRGGTATLFDTSQLTAGRHIVTAKAILMSGGKIVASAAFYKDETAPSPMTTASTTAAPATTAPTTTAATTTAPEPIDQPSTSASTNAARSTPARSDRKRHVDGYRPTHHQLESDAKATATTSAGFPDGSNTGVSAASLLSTVT